MPKLRKPIPAELPEPETIDIDALAEDLRSGLYELVCVLGPTASGKTRYAVRLAHELSARGLPAEIVSADSRQVYRGMDIGTGKDLAEYGDIPYHLIDIREAGEQYNVYDFTQDFRAAFADIRARGKVAILCGGTGLYINAVTAGYDFRTSKPLSQPAVSGQPSTPLAIRARQRARPCPTRGARSGHCLSESNQTGCPEDVGTASPRTFFIGTLVDRETRNARIDARLRARLEEGMTEEIRGLLEHGVPAETLIGYGLEYKFVTLFLQGQLTWQDELYEKLSTAIHQFAKRQMTWFRGMERSGVKIHWVEV